MKIRISLLANNEELSIKALDLIKHLGYPVSLESNTDYSFNAQWNRCFFYKDDFVIGMDEDCFITNPDALQGICEYMQQYQIGLMAMKELSGVAKHRLTVKNANDKDYNSFFMITQPAILKPYVKPASAIKNMYIGSEWLEPYWPIFRYLDDCWVNNKEFKGYTHEDGISTILTFDDKPFCVHSWFARCYNYAKPDEYGIDQRKRIDSIYKEVLNGSFK